ncbi:MAG TPA: hypothetical protein VF851_06530 [Steroidobacteraceae bacterium]
MQGLPHALDGRRRSVILVVALVVFWLAQAMAIAHASRHVGSDAPGLPGDHGQLCTDCASMLPLLAVAGGLCAAVFVAARAVLTILPRVEVRTAQVAAPLPFRSRAPPL